MINRHESKFGASAARKKPKRYKELRRLFARHGFFVDGEQLKHPAIDYWVYDQSIKEICRMRPDVADQIIEYILNGHSIVVSRTGDNVKVIGDNGRMARIEQIRAGDIIEVLLVCRKFSYCLVEENDDKKRQLKVRSLDKSLDDKEYGYGSKHVISYTVAINADVPPLIALALAGEAST